MAGEEQRQWRRYLARLPLIIELPLEDRLPIHAHTVNISAGGVCVELPCHLLAFSLVDVRLTLPAAQGHEPIDVSYAAVVVWCDPDVPGGYQRYLAGLSFVAEDREAEGRLDVALRRCFA